MRRIKMDSSLTSLTEINVKWIKDLNVKSEIIKRLEKNIWITPLGIGLGNYFLDMTPTSQAIKAKINSRTTSN